MGRVLLEGGIIILLVLIGISIFIPSGDDVNDVIVEFENSIESGNIVDDGEIENVEVSVGDKANFIARLNSKIANTIVNGLNSILELGIKFLREIIN
jgi:hypothetical protein